MQIDERQIYLGFDFGLKRIGVAVGQGVTKTATTLNILHAINGAPNWKEVDQLINDWKPKALIVGIPIGPQGEQPITFAARKFATQLERYDIPIHTIDELLTTKEARQRLFDMGGFQALKKSEIDSFAAKLILESWMNS